MSSDVPVPTFSLQGWVKDKTSKMDFLLSHFFVADYNQTQLYKGHVASLTRIIQLNPSDAEAIMVDLKETLTSYLTNYYDSVSVLIEATPDINTSPAIKFDLKISIQVTDSDGSSRYDRMIKTQDSKLSEIIKLNNYG